MLTAIRNPLDPLFMFACFDDAEDLTAPTVRQASRSRL